MKENGTLTYSMERLDDVPLSTSREAKEGQQKTSVPHEYNNVRVDAGAVFNRRSQLPRRRENDRREAYGRQYQVLPRGGYGGHTRDPPHTGDRMNARRTPAGNNKQMHTHSTTFTPIQYLRMFIWPYRPTNIEKQAND